MSYFVTGATGFIGRYLVREILARSANELIYILVRETSNEKLAAIRTWWGAESERVIPIVGDLAAPALGLNVEDLQQLSGSVTHFFHLAALYDLQANAADLERANVAGTRNALECAELIRSRSFHLCSSIAAAGTYSGKFTEEMFEEATGLDHPYFRTKHDSEGLVRAQRAIPWRIYRPGMVVGDSQTGFIPKVDGPYYFFKALQLMRRFIPEWLPTIGFEGGYVNIVPVDYVAKAMCYLAHCEGQDFRCFHLTDPHPRYAGEVLNLFAKAGHAPSMTLRLESHLLEIIGRQMRAVIGSASPFTKAIDQILDDLQIPADALRFANVQTIFDNTHTAALLERAAIRLPPLEDYAWRLWDYWERELDARDACGLSLDHAVRGKRILITGGSSGIGKASALRLADAGAIVLLVARDPVKLQATRQEIEARGAHAYTYACDITDPQACARLVQEVFAEHQGVDVLINNAGRSIRRSIEISYDRFHDFERLMDLNYFAAVRLTLALLPQMVAQRNGHVIMISSIGVLSNSPRFSGYLASKAALETFARCASAEYREQGVHFTVINMPLVRTPMIAPTRAYDRLPTMSPTEASGFIVDAIVGRPPRVVTRLGQLARLLELVSPKLADVINSASFAMFPDSAAARGEAEEAPPTQEAIAFATLLKEIHW
jgi:NAD(P)-dependent dehydrogenase (short-subunit alcohol dehydrogenase family)